MKKEILEFFEGFFKKLPLSLLCGFGVGSFIILFMDTGYLNSNKITQSNLFIAMINYNPLLFWISFFIGVLWSNSLIKEMRMLSYKKFIFYRLPIILILYIAVFFLGK
jgi:hypothetical protein